jgi:biotin-dependent carboxylase-like uncharacterized protein
MDRWALSEANRLVGNPPGSAAIEWALGGGTLRFEHAGICALSGARVQATLDGSPIDAERPLAVRAGSELKVTRLLHRRFIYLAVSGGIEVPQVLASRSTYLPGRFGGMEGRRLRSGDRLSLGPSAVPSPGATGAKGPSYDSPLVRVTFGPQASLFDAEGWETFLGNEFRVSLASDRTGYRLDGPALTHDGEAALPSEPGCVGAVQVPEGGTPIALMADGPTVGGYPKIAVVIWADLPVLAQKKPGDPVRFQVVTMAAARRAWLELWGSESLAE